MTSRFLIASLATLAIVVSCSPANDTTISKGTYEDYEIVQTHQISWNDVLNQEDDNYIVFIYSETCGYCHDMLNEIVSFANEEILITYFLNSSLNPVTIGDDNPIGITEIENLTIRGTPTIIEIDEKMVIANIPGIDQCLTYLNDKRLERNDNP